MTRSARPGITRSITPTRNVICGVACGSCPVRTRCATSKTGRTLSLHHCDRLLRAARVDRAADARLREDYTKHRPHVERAIAQVTTWRGRRLKLRYRGVVKNAEWSRTTPGSSAAPPR